ncbi:MAG: IclR family transcriptional regulator [Acetobacteraceae bacterium]
MSRTATLAVRQKRRMSKGEAEQRTIVAKDIEQKPLHKNHESYFVPGLHRGLMILEALAEARRPLTVTELGRKLGLSRSSTFRLTYTLSQLGFIETSEEAKVFRLGPRVLNIGFAYLASQDLIEMARADLEVLRNNTNVSAHLAIRDNREVLYLSCVQSRSGFLSNMNVGSRLPAYATPLGWLLLSDLSSREMAALFAGQTLEPLTDLTPQDLQTLSQRVAESVAVGHVVSRGFVESGGSSISAPVFDKNGMVVAAIDISGPDSAFDLSQIEHRYVDEVRSAAMRISMRFGFVPAHAAGPRLAKAG